MGIWEYGNMKIGEQGMGKNAHIRGVIMGCIGRDVC
jgi:hypothetical protein